VRKRGQYEYVIFYASDHSNGVKSLSIFYW